MENEESKKKPLHSLVFYLDGIDSHEVQPMVAMLETLGAKCAKTFSPEVNYLVTNRNTHLPPPKHTHATRKRRAEQMLSLAPSGTDDIVATARKLGVKICADKEFFPWVRKAYNKHCNTQSFSTERYLILEDTLRQYKPLAKEIPERNIPRLHVEDIRSFPFISPFYTKEEGEKWQKKVKKVNIQKKERKECYEPKRKAGYCECCQEKYTVLEESPQHEKFACNDSNYSKIDALCGFSSTQTE